ncbi:MAG: metallophosphoesterase [Acidobacteriota bacterium]
MLLQEIIGHSGAQEIEAAGSIRFHATGDTGRPEGSDAQEEVAEEMATDFHPDGGGLNPAFFLHLGDIIYGHRKDALYRDEFYRPYKRYPGKILAVAGNHDGEVFRESDPQPLRAFLANFCASRAEVPPIARDVRIFRETMTQPGVFWRLDAPFLHLVGLYSNIAEGPGFLEGRGNDESQKTWLARTLREIRQERDAGRRKALVFAVHHPPYSNGGHSGSSQMLATLDGICQEAGVMPDAVLSGHSHNYQRHTRRISFEGRSMEIPFVVAGCGGHNDSSVDEAFGQVIGDRTFDRSLRGFGYLLVTASPQKLAIDLWQVPSHTDHPFDSIKVDLSTNRLV